jgi:D-3-phosphoglycerate dehydrogenase / 2-oxoglutarate reductase
MPVVLVTDHPAPDTAIEARMLAAIGAEIRVAPTGAEDELVGMAGDAVAILTCFKHVTPAVVRAAPKLQVIGRYGVGVDNISVSTATERGIPVTNVPVYCVDEVAEHALALILTLARGTALYDASVRDGAWDLAVGIPLHRIAGRTLGIVGFGHIGRALATRARSLGLALLVNDRSATAADVEPFGAELADLDDLLSRSDIVSLHVPLTPDTQGLIDAARLGLMRPGAFLVNCARGAVVDLDALAEALSANRIAGAGLDVFVPERLPFEHPLVGLRNVVLTPHVAFYSEESIAELQARATQNVIDVLSGVTPEHIVNRADLASTGMPRG